MMNRFLLGVLLWVGCRAQAASPAVMESAQTRIAAFHQGEADNEAVIRVVYFHAADREPLEGFQDRLSRGLNDISRFYREEMEQRFGVAIQGLRFESVGDDVVIRVVRGQHPTAHYHHESGDEAWAEVKAALRDVIYAEREHVLILYGLCELDAEGRYVFDAPYYGAGWSDHRRGLCHAADCPLLDPQLLTDAKTPFVFKEHNFERMELTVAKFNSWYLGGLAHELGHGLGFPHDNGRPREAIGSALMGGGNLHYREDLWGGRKPSYLSLATALRLAAHPLTTRSDKGRWQEADGEVEELKATAEKGVLRLAGKVAASIPVCAVIASVWSKEAKTDHGAMTFCSAVDNDGRFEIEVTNLNEPAWNLKLGCLQVNGAESNLRLRFECDDEGAPKAAQMVGEWMVRKAEEVVMKQPDQAANLLSSGRFDGAPTAEAQRQMELVRGMLEFAPEPVDLIATDAGKVSLADAKWMQAQVGYGKVTRNRYCFERSRWQGVLLRLAGDVYEKGISAHADSRLVYALGGKWKAFSATVGLQDGADGRGSAIFSVLADGVEVFRSQVMRAGERADIKVDVTDVEKLELRAVGGEGHNASAWSIWVDPLVVR